MIELENEHNREAYIEAIKRILNLPENFAAGLKYWDSGKLAKIADRFFGEDSESELEKFVSELREYELPPNVLPLSPDRKPFAKLDDETIKESVKWAICFPEKDGRLTNAIRERLAVDQDFPKEYIMVEAHLDTTRMDQDLQNSAIRLGFEIDNFNKIVPADYADHFTLGFAVPAANKERYKELRELVSGQMRALAKEVDAADSEGYIEMEVYGNSPEYMDEIPWRAISEEGLKNFPFESGVLEQIDVPVSDNEMINLGMGSELRKAADIHVKTPSGARGEEYQGSESLEENELRGKLREMGLYEVITEAGNKIYTGQFIKMEEALFVYRILRDHFRKYGGVFELYVEPCSTFWRKKMDDGRSARIPPLVRLKPEWRKRLEEEMRTRKTA